ncbi:metal ABC transporter solute-binding protein, Zn/Mn family [Pusillimonas noertemannii]|uniref:Zinc/manganese transport system substrate-binding protein n=1 Tax=Pusillimonas noertemannii TaxID=305977 RepID=A0A2U1CM64_9BURK|nr:zinc ABC transporter substrate-binding protein [Pusillimonas noertemannii]NYT68884.1 zinc ABC transporter substrate-binding protein [Pusillimonas noertemannii]PVY62095.1 zinc/manganese transport system substrate-binding protein [Pusillimonas noertemannii]TFL10910.1 metal ABC transporter substrate-binding protein [Pusillimonas noertemannii]
MFKSGKLIFMSGIAALALLAWPQANAHELHVVSTFSIVSDFARNVGGERIALTTLVGPNGDAHSYEPKPADAVAVGQADVVLANGLHFEGFLDRLVQASNSTAPIVTLTRDVELLRNAEDEHEHDNHEDHDHDHDHAQEHTDSHDHGHAKEHAHHHHHGEYDPHAWQSVRNAQVYVTNIAKAFCAADAAGCPSYQANAKSYDEKLQALETELKAAVAQIPASQRTVITSHDAFGYLGRAYGLQFLAPQGLSTGSEASAAGVAALIQQIKKQEASAIFLENVSNPRLIQQIATETGMKIGGKLYSDALSPADGPASTYIDMMRHNVSTIRDAVLGR